jgi:hypothetical protein
MNDRASSDPAAAFRTTTDAGLEAGLEGCPAPEEVVREGSALIVAGRDEDLARLPGHPESPGTPGPLRAPA